MSYNINMVSNHSHYNSDRPGYLWRVVFTTSTWPGPGCFSPGIAGTGRVCMEIRPEDLLLSGDQTWFDRKSPMNGSMNGSI